MAHPKDSTPAQGPLNSFWPFPAGSHATVVLLPHDPLDDLYVPHELVEQMMVPPPQDCPLCLAGDTPGDTPGDARPGPTRLQLLKQREHATPLTVDELFDGIFGADGTG